MYPAQIYLACCSSRTSSIIAEKIVGTITSKVFIYPAKFFSAFIMHLSPNH